MKAIQLVALAGISMLAMSNSCGQAEDAAPSIQLTAGRVVRYETTVDDNLQNPRIRWVVDISPLALPGVGGKNYQRAKLFNLPDTLNYRTGTSFLFHYQLVPYAQQTPWRTYYERFGMISQPYDVELMPEIKVSDVQLSQTK